jgi:uncharacterized membrane protein
MIWLGGICVGLAGIFLAKYSIDRGMLGPAQRIILACTLGVAFHGLAEWLRRKTGESHPAFAALAGGSSIILYAAMVAALHLYQLLSPSLVFAILAFVSLLTMLLALYYGPILVILGNLGAYLVPLLVTNTSDSILVALVYSLIICASTLVLVRYVYRPWIWYGTFCGALAWWLVSCTTSQADGFRGFYLAALAYLLLAVPVFDWLLNRTPELEDPGNDSISFPSFPSSFTFLPTQVVLALIVLALGVSISLESFSPQAALTWSPLIIIILLACRARPELSSLLWLSLIVQWFAWLYCGLDLTADGIRYSSLFVWQQKDFLVFAGIMVGLYSGLGWALSIKRPYSHTKASLIIMAPVLWLALAYLLVTDLSVDGRWAACSLVLAMFYLITAAVRLQQNQKADGSVWMILAAHFALSLAMAMYFRQATLTLVLSTQLISLATLHRRFSVPGIEWISKGVIALIIIRLTTNPLLLTYPTDMHWSLWTYGGATLCCAVAAWISREEERIAKWLEAAALHLFVLFLFAEIRYWLYDGNIFAHEYSLKEAALYTGLWSLLGLVYSYRARVASSLAPLYLGCSKILLVLALLNYGLMLIGMNPLWSGEVVSSVPFLNILLLAYGLPVVAAYLAYRYYDPQFRTTGGWVAAIGFLIFVSLEIRHLWNGSLDLNLGFQDGELYTYSIVWLAIAVITILIAASKDILPAYRAGMALLMVVIAKIFLIDMDDLEGLLRVASFMGLGLSLLGLAYLHQRISRAKEDEDLITFEVDEAP